MHTGMTEEGSRFAINLTEVQLKYEEKKYLFR